MKYIAAISVICLTLTTGSTTALGAVAPLESVSRNNNIVVLTNFANNAMREIHMAELSNEAKARANSLALEQRLKLAKNSAKVYKALKKLRATVNKTWYVFSGATPRGWDCSGLTMWFYNQVGVEIEHRASKQDTSGIETDNPKAGDLVVFHYKNNHDAYHVGVYIGNGKMIHAPKHGHLTRVESVNKFAGKYSEVTYREIIKTI